MCHGSTHLRRSLNIVIAIYTKYLFYHIHIALYIDPIRGHRKPHAYLGNTINLDTQRV